MGAFDVQEFSTGAAAERGLAAIISDDATKKRTISDAAFLLMSLPHSNVGLSQR
jgi:hypothetical protein